MATYSIVNTVTASYIDVFTTAIDGTPSAAEVRVVNSDGTITTIAGVGLTLSGGVATGGTITSITRRSADGLTTFETTTGLVAANNSFASFWNAANAAARFSYISSQTDTLNGSSGVDALNGGAGADTVYGAGGIDTIDGGAGTDTLYGGVDNDIISTGGGSTSTFEYAYGGSGDDSITVTGSGYAQVYGDSSNGDGSAVVDGNDTIDLSGAGVNALAYTWAEGGGGADRITGSAGLDYIYGGAGQDSIYSYGGSDIIDGGTEADFLEFFRTSATGNIIFTASANFTVNVGGFSESTIANVEQFDVRTGAGNDQITTLDANDTIYGGGGGDTINAGGGDDEIFAGSGYTTGETENDTLNGGAGNDYIFSAGGVDSIDGGSEADFLEFSRTSATGDIIFTASANFTVTVGGVSESTIANVEAFSVSTGSGNDQITTLGGDDFIYGGAGADTINAGGGSDYIYGAFDRSTDADNDTLNGEAGNDYIFSLGGTDSIDGGADTDYLRFSRTSATGDIIFTASANFTVTVGGAAESTIANVEQFDVSTGSGNDQITTLGGNDDIYGGAGTDTLNGAGGNDRIYGEAGIDTIDGGAGNDALFGGVDNDIISTGGSSTSAFDTAYGGSGNDSITVTGSGYATVHGDYTNGDESEVVDGDDTIDLSGAGVNTGAYIQALGGGGADTITDSAGTDFMSGGAGNDAITSSGGVDTINGGTEYDTLRFSRTSATADIIFSASAIFTVTVGGVSESAIVDVEQFTVRTGSGNDQITTLGGNDIIQGGGGADTLNSGAGDDVFYFEGDASLLGLDQVDGGSESDTLDFGTLTSFAWVDLAATGVEAWSLVGSTWHALANTVSVENVIGTGLADSIWGNSQNNMFFGGAGGDQLYGRDGNDTFFYASATDGRDYADGGAGSDTVDLAGLATFAWVDLAFAGDEVWTFDGAWVALANTVSVENAVGTSLNDYLYGSAADNVLAGGSGNDQLYGRDGNDTFVFTGINHGLDFVDGGNNSDTVDLAGIADDFAWVDLAFAGPEVWVNTGGTWTAIANIQNVENAVGTAGNDFLYGNAQNNVLTGGAGNDRIEGRDGNDTFVFAGSTIGRDVISGGNNTDTIDFSGFTGGAVWADLAFAGDEVWTNSGAGWVRAADLSSIENLTGSNQADFLLGDGNANVIAGGGGNDSLTGRGGADTFRFDTLLATTNVDTITDFTVVDDTIQLENAIFTGFASTGFSLTAANLSLTGAAVGTAAQIIYNSATGSLAYDADGTGSAAAISFANIGTGKALTLADFEVI